MVAIVPLITGIALGLTVPRRTAIIAQGVFYLLAATVLIATAPNHDATYTTGAVLAAGLLPVAALSLAAGIYLHGRRTTHSPNSR